MIDAAWYRYIMHPRFRAAGPHSKRVFDLVLVPGLLLGRPRWPWMAARAALNLAQAGWLAGAARRSDDPALARGAAAALAALTLVDGPAAVALRRAGA